MPFIYATSRVWRDWTYYYTLWGSINSICGLGKEFADWDSLSFNSWAVVNGHITNNVYSIEIKPYF